MMKRYVRWLCAALFLLAAAGIFWFLHLFTQVPVTMEYVNWQTSASVDEDGTLHEWNGDNYGNSGEISGSYRFSGTLPENLPEGHLLFETAGMDLSLELNGEVLYQSRVSSVDAGAEMAQATVPLSAGASGTITMDCTVSGGPVSMFPPLVRFIPTNLELMQNSAFSFRSGIPAGAAAFALLLALGIFLLGISIKKPDFSLVPLLVALTGLAVFRISQDSGSYFLPEPLNAFLSHGRNGLLILAALLLYLVMNRRRSFWKQLGAAAVWSAAAFFLCWLFSAWRDGYLAYYIGDVLISDLRSGYYDGLVYWLTFWLASIATLISAYGVGRSFAKQEGLTQGLLLKNKMAEENYRELREQMEQTAALRHEWRHQLTTLECLYDQKDFDGIGELLSDVLKKQKAADPVPFTDNQTINVILQDASAKAAREQVYFRANADVPDSLPIPDADLCTLLMNMLDNALEAAVKVPEREKRYVSIRIRLANNGNYLAVKCENSYTGPILEDQQGNLCTSKDDPALHGFGMRQMMEIARRYTSTLLISYGPGKPFVVQTALLLPEPQDREIERG